MLALIHSSSIWAEIFLSESGLTEAACKKLGVPWRSLSMPFKYKIPLWYFLMAFLKCLALYSSLPSFLKFRAVSSFSLMYLSLLISNFSRQQKFFKNSWKTPFILTSFNLTRNFGSLTSWMNSRNIYFLFCRIENKCQDYFFQDYFASTKMRATLCTNFHATSTIWPRRKKTKKCFKVSQCIHFYKRNEAKWVVTYSGLAINLQRTKKNPLFCPWERRRKHSYKWDYQSGRRSKNCVSLSPLLRSRPRQMGACAAAKKLRNQCVAHTVLPTTGGPLRCTMLEASFLIILGSRAGGIYCQNHSFAGHIALYWHALVR